MCVQTLFLDVFFSFFLNYSPKMIWGALQNPVGAKTRPNIDQVTPKWCPKHCSALAFSALEKRKYMQKRQVDCTFVFLFSPFRNVQF